MKVKMKVSMASADWSYMPEQIVEVTLEVANAWEVAGIAEKTNEIETAVIMPKETTAKRKAVKKDGDN